MPFALCKESLIFNSRVTDIIAYRYRTVSVIGLRDRCIKATAQLKYICVKQSRKNSKQNYFSKDLGVPVCPMLNYFIFHLVKEYNYYAVSRLAFDLTSRLLVMMSSIGSVLLAMRLEYDDTLQLRILFSRNLL